MCNRIMKNRWFTVLLALLTISCSQQKEMISVDVDQAMSTPLSKQLSSVVETLEYVALETDSNSLIGDHYKVAVFEKDIAIIGGRKVLLFDRSSGKFKKEILHWGNDPEGHSGTMVGKGLVANEKAGYIFLREWDKHLSTYHIYTGERKRFPVKTIKSIAYTDDDSFVTTAFNFDGQHRVKMWIYDQYQCVDSIPNRWYFKLMFNAMMVIHNDEIFYRMNDRTYFKDLTNDTVFAVTDTLTPAFSFRSSKLPQIELREHPETIGSKIKEIYFVENIVEDHAYIYYTVMYGGKPHNLVYDKASGENGLLKEGFTNDIDGKINLFPDHITDRGEYVFVLNPASMSEEELATCHLKEDDNPMVVIGK